PQIQPLRKVRQIHAATSRIVKSRQTAHLSDRRSRTSSRGLSLSAFLTALTHSACDVTWPVGRRQELWPLHAAFWFLWLTMNESFVPAAMLIPGRAERKMRGA